MGKVTPIVEPTTLFASGDAVEWCERSKTIMGDYLGDPALADAKGKVVSIYGDNGIGETLYNVDWSTGQSKVIAEGHLVKAA